ncbi:MAG: aspartate aminotransferase family protein [bacterium]
MGLYEEAERYYLHAYGRYDVILDHGEGVYLYDTNGKRYLDFYSGIGVNALGHGYPAYIEALKAQMDDVMHVANYFYATPAIDAAKKVVEATGLSQVFFCNSGAEATEGALKLARKAYFLKHGKADSEVISFHHSFHGRTTGSVKLTGNYHYQEAFGPLMDHVKYATLNDLESVKVMLTEKTAAIIVEPVQGEGGVNPCTKEFLQGLRKLCDERDICLILDEVQCGMGRTGTIMTYFQYDVLPDIVCLAKGIGCGVPVGAFVANEKYGKALQPGDHGSTYGGNPFVCRAVSTVFDIFREDQILDNVQRVSAYLVEKLDDLTNRYDVVEGHRGLGLMQGLVLKKPAGPIAKALLDAGVIVVTAGPNVLRMLPPLIIKEEHVDAFIEQLEIVLQNA